MKSGFSYKHSLWAAAVAVVLVVTGCSGSGAKQAGSVQSPTPSESAVVSASPSPSPTASPAAATPSATAPAASTKPKPGVTVSSPQTSPQRLVDMFFLDRKTGWAAAITGQSSALWRTTDGGATWTAGSAAQLRIGALAFADASRGWAVGRTGCREDKGRIVCKQLHVARTDDAGAHWQTKWSAEGDTFGDDSGDRVFAVNGDTVYVIGGTRLLETTDGGKTWKAIDAGIGPFIPEEGSFLQDGKNGWVLGRVGHGCKAEVREATDKCATVVIGTTDGGAHWRMLWSPQDSTNLRTAGISFVNAQKGWMLILNMENLQATLYGTTDGGKQWAKVSEMRGGRPYVRGLQFVNERDGFIPLSAGAGPIGGGLLKTTDGGVHFERIVPENKEWSFEQLQFFSDTDGWVRVSDPEGDYLMYTSDGGKNWRTSKPQAKK